MSKEGKYSYLMRKKNKKNNSLLITHMDLLQNKKIYTKIVLMELLRVLLKVIMEPFSLMDKQVLVKPIQCKVQ